MKIRRHIAVNRPANVNYIYTCDGMRVIRGRDANNRPQGGYTRGLDPSGTFESWIVRERIGRL